MYPKNERVLSPFGIVPESLLLDRSSDWSSVRLAKGRGIGPVKVLLDKLSAINVFKRPMDSRMFPSSPFPEKSMVLYERRTFVLQIYSVFVTS